MSALVKWYPSYDSIALLEVFDSRTHGNYLATAFVRSCAWQFGGEAAGADHAICMAK